MVEALFGALDFHNCHAPNLQEKCMSEDFRVFHLFLPGFMSVGSPGFPPKAAKGGPQNLEPVGPKATAKWLSAWISSQADSEDLSGNGWFHVLGLKN